MSYKKFVLLSVGEEKYGVDIDSISSIDEYQDMTRIPNMPDYCEGVINFRGDIVPVINLKKKFGQIQAKEVGENSKMVMVNTDKGIVGFMVDEASNIVELDKDDIEPVSEMIVEQTGNSYIYGVGKTDEDIITVIDLEKVATQ